MKFDPKIEIGDIMLKRSFDPLWLLISTLSFPKTVLNWPSKRHLQHSSIHNAIFGIFNGTEGIFESKIGKGFLFIPWEKYYQQIKKGGSEIKVARIAQGLSNNQKNTLTSYLKNKVNNNVPYDFLGALVIAIDAFITRPLFKWQFKKRWYCTESVDIVFHHIGIELFKHPELPSPPAVEQKLLDGTLIEITDYF